MAPRPKPLRERVERLSHRDGSHLIWDGALTPSGRPFMAKLGNPARVLLDLVDQPRIQVRNGCGLARCIDPFHQKVIKMRDHKYGDLPEIAWPDPRDPATSKFTERELQDIEDHVPLVQDDEVTEQEMIEGGLEPHVIQEIMKRARSDI